MKMIFKKIKRLFNNIDKAPKYTCGCCGYKTHPDNGIGEICPVCYWQEDYTSVDNLFEYSSANNCTLYEAQENYQMIGASQKQLKKYCRTPYKYEIKDPSWIPLQSRIEMQYRDTTLAINKIRDLIDKLKYPNATYIYNNFKSLPEILIFDNNEYYECSCSPYDDTTYESQLLLKALAIYLKMIMENNLINLILMYYKAGLDYYIGWTILLMAAMSNIPMYINEKFSDLLIDIEINNFHGIESLRNSMKSYWISQYIFPKNEFITKDNIDINTRYLMDKKTDVGTRDDIVMDLADSDLPEAENALITLAYNNDESFLDDALGEGIGQIWLRKNKISCLCLNKIPSPIRSHIIGTILSNHKLVDTLYSYAEDSKIAITEKFLDDIASFAIWDFVRIYNSNQRDAIASLAVRILSILHRANSGNKLIDFYKLCLTAYISNEINPVFKLANTIANTTSYKGPVTKLEHYAYLYINALINLLATQVDNSKQYKTKLLRYVETYFPQYNSIANIVGLIIETSTSNKSLGQIRKDLLDCIDHVKANKNSEFYIFHTYLLILLNKLLEVPFPHYNMDIK